jgi:hypothetical protein
MFNYPLLENKMAFSHYELFEMLRHEPKCLQTFNTVPAWWVMARVIIFVKEKTIDSKILVRHFRKEV